MKEFIIDKVNEKQRLDKYVKRILPNSSNSFIYKMLRKKNIELNSKRAKGDEILKCGDSVKLFFSDETYLKMSQATPVSSNEYDKAYNEFKGIDVIFDHEDFMIVYKPSGILSQKDESQILSLNEWCLGYLLKSGFIDVQSLTYFKPSVLNRLDRNTKGLVLVGKTLRGSRRISEMLNVRSLHKYYYAVVEGNCDLKGEYSAYLVKNSKTNKVFIYDSVKEIPDNQKYSYIKTFINPIDFDGQFTKVEIELITGKSHQIRAHLSHLGFPLKGDYKYNARIETEAKFQDLTAYKVEFPILSEEDEWHSLSGKIFKVDK